MREALPVAIVDVNDAWQRLHRQAELLSRWLGCLHRSLQRARVDRGDGAVGEALGQRMGLSQPRVVQRQVNSSAKALTGAGSDVPCCLTMSHQDDSGHGESPQLEGAWHLQNLTENAEPACRKTAWNDQIQAKVPGT